METDVALVAKVKMARKRADVNFILYGGSLLQGGKVEDLSFKRR